jgi:hypothetical protein
LVADLTGDFLSFSGFVTRLDLMQGTTVVESVTSEDDLGASVEFTGLSFTLTKDVVFPFTIRATLEDGEVINLGSTFAVDVDPSNIRCVRSAKTTIATAASSATVIDGKDYQVASETPTVTILDQVAKNTTLQIKNNSSYDLIVNTLTVEMTQNRDGGSYIDWTGSADLLDAIGGTVIDSQGSVPGSITFDVNYQISNSDTLDRVIELIDDIHTITDADYTLTVKEMNFDYTDGTDTSATDIDESYNVSK